MKNQTIYEAPKLGRIQYTSPFRSGEPHIELLFPLPVWPKPLDKQFYRFLEREPWIRKDLYYLALAGIDEPRPILAALEWGRFFYARYQTGYGTLDWANGKGHACIEVQQSEHMLLDDFSALHPCCWEDAIRETLSPIAQSFVYEPLTSRELFHRNTVKKLERLHLLQPED